jgi:hypothetical protein
MRNKENRGTFRRALTAVAVTASSLVAFGVASIPAIPAASAQPTCTDSWTGTAGDGMWTTGANWNAGVPSGSSVACIQLAGTYTVTISGSASAAVLELGATSGTQTLDISGASTQSTLSLATATGSDIAGHGILELDNGSGSTLLTGGNGVTLVNDGTFETLGGSATNDYLRVNLTNDSDGTVNISGASTLQDSSTTTTNKGAFTLSSGGSLALSGSSNFTDSGGTLADKGALNLNGGTFIQSGGTESANAVVISGATLTDSAGKGSFSLVGGSDFSGTIPSGQTVTILGNSTYGQANVTATNGLVNNGTLAVDSEATSAAILAGGNGVTVTNNGTFETLGATGAIDYLRDNLINATGGTVDISGATNDQDSTTTTTNKGAFTVSSGADLDLSGSSNFTDSSGTLSNKGALNLNGGTFIQSGGTESANAVVISGATLTDSAGKGSFTLVGGSDLSGTIPSGQTVTILGNSTNGQANVTATNGLVNNGTLAVDSEATSAALLSGGNGVTVTNNGTFETLGATGAIDYLRVNLINAAAATVDISGVTTDQDSTTTTTNSGTFTVGSGDTLDLSGGSNFTDSSGTLANNGTLNLNGGGTFTQSGGTESANAVVIDGATLTDSAGKGSFTLVGGSDLSGTIPSGQTVTILGNSTNGQANVTAATGLVNDGTLAVDAEGTNSALLSGGSGVTITNNGTFETLGATGAIDYLRVDLINSSGGTVDLSGVTNDQDSTTTTTNDGTLSVADGATLALSGGSQLVEGTTATFQPTVDATNGAFGVTGGTVSLAGTLGITTVGKPTLGQAFNVVSGSTVSGSFSGFDFGPNAYVITVGASSVTATTATPFKLTGKNVAANEDLPFSGTVATHTTGSQAGPVYTATINWGDGTGTTSGTTTKTAVTGKHNYSSTGTFTITTTLRDQFGTVETVTSTATVTLPPAPTVTLVKPASVTAGKSATLTITGTDFTTNSSVSFSNSGITVTSVTWKSASSLSVKIKVAGKAAAGAGNVSVTTPGGTGGCTSCLTVIVPPKVTSISGPLAPGAKTTVTVKGSGFETGLAVTTNITGATVGSITSVTSTSFSVSITVPSGTAPGSTYKLTVTNPDGGKVTYSKLAVS